MNSPDQIVDIRKQGPTSCFWPIIPSRKMTADERLGTMGGKSGAGVMALLTSRYRHHVHSRTLMDVWDESVV
jgi:hypothetical protein